MSRAPAILRLLLLAWSGIALAWSGAPAHAEPPAAPAASSQEPSAAAAARSIYRLDPPPGWAALPGQAQRFAQGRLSISPLGPQAVTAHASVWRSGTSGAALIVTWERAPVTTGEAGAQAAGAGAPLARAAKLIRRGLDDVRAQPERAALEPGETELGSWHEAVSDNLAEGRLEWRHTRHRTTTLVRTVLFHDRAGQLHQVTAECMLGEDGAALRGACDSALASLAITVPLAERVALAPLPAAAADLAASGSAGASAPAQPPALQDLPTAERVAPSFRDPGAGPPAGQILYAADPEGGDGGTWRQQWLYGLGLLLLAVAFYATTRKRAASQRDSSESSERDSSESSERDSSESSEGDSSEESGEGDSSESKEKP